MSEKRKIAAILAADIVGFGGTANIVMDGLGVDLRFTVAGAASAWPGPKLPAALEAVFEDFNIAGMAQS